MKQALRSRSTLLIVAAVLAGGVGGFVIGRATDDSSSTTALSPQDQDLRALRAYIRSKQRTTTTPVKPGGIPRTSDGSEEIQIPADIPQEFVDRCRDTLKETPQNEPCQLLIKAANGEIEPGLYPESQRDELLAK
jgi:hypothetical protein